MDYKVKKVLELINGTVMLVVDGERKEFVSGQNTAAQYGKEPNPFDGM